MAKPSKTVAEAMDELNLSIANSDGSFKPGSKFPLRTYGAGGAAEIRWEFNGRPVKHGGDGYYVINESGTLQAVIFWEDGNIDKVIKQIIISQEK